MFPFPSPKAEKTLQNSQLVVESVERENEIGDKQEE